MHVPGFGDQRQAGDGGAGGQPLGATDALAEDGPGEEQRPDRHGVDQHRRLARATFDQCPGLEHHECADLHEADDEGGAGLDEAQRPAEQLENEQQGECAAEAAFGGEGEGRGVFQRLFCHYPRIAPDEA